MIKKNNKQFVNMFENFTIEDLIKLKKGSDDYDNKSNDFILITAPKEIKLSEILDRLNKEHKAIINGNVIYEYKLHRNGWYNEDGTPYHISDISIDSYHYGKKLVSAIRFTPKMTIIEIDFGEKYKWLYTLWIAGTTIIDDLEGQNEQH
mgnify:CR=1 FL=1